MIDRKKLAYSPTHTVVLINLLCHRADDEEALREAVEQRLAWELEEFPLVGHNLKGLFEHEQEGSEDILFFECTLFSPSGQCFDAKDKLHWIDWWN